MQLSSQSFSCVFFLNSQDLPPGAFTGRTFGCDLKPLGKPGREDSVCYSVRR